MVVRNPNTSKTTNANQIGPADPATFNSANISHQRSGLVCVLASYSGECTAQAALVVTLSRDGTTVLVSQTLDAGDIGEFPFAASLPVLDTLPDNAAHFYQLSVSSAGATTETIPVGFATISLFEL
jgi:hypothetical protein